MDKQYRFHSTISRIRPLTTREWSLENKV